MYQKLFKSVAEDVLNRMPRKDKSMFANLTPMGPNKLTGYTVYKFFRNVKQQLHEEHIDEDSVMGDTLVTITGYRPWWGTIPEHWVTTMVVSDEPTRDLPLLIYNDSSDEDSDEEELSIIVDSVPSVKRKLSFMSDEDDIDGLGDVNSRFEDEDEELPPGMHMEEGIVYMHADMCPSMGDAIDEGYEPPSRKRKRSLVPTRFSKRVAARLRKKRRFFGN